MTAMAADAGRCPISAQSEIPGVSRPAYYAMRGKNVGKPAPDPATDDAVKAYELGRRHCCAGKIKHHLRAGAST